MGLETIGALTERAVRLIVRDLPADDAALFLFDKHGRLTRVAPEGTRERPIPVESYSQQREGTVAHVVPDVGAPSQHGSVVVGRAHDYEWGPADAASFYHQRFGSSWWYACFPLDGPNRTYGALRVIRVRDEFDDRTLGALSVFAHQIAITISHLRRELEIDAIGRIVRSLTASHVSVDTVADAMAGALTRPWTEFAACTVRIANRKGNLELAALAGSPEVDINRKDRSPRPADHGIVGDVFSSGRARIIADARAELAAFEDQEWILRNGFVTFACFPVAAGRRVVGTLSLFLLYRYHFYPSKVRFIDDVSQQLANAITIARLLHTRSELLSQQKSIASPVNEVDRILQTIVDNGAELTGASAGYIALASRIDDTLHPRVSTSNLPFSCIPTLPLNGGGLTPAVMATRQSLNCGDVPKQPNYEDFNNEWVGRVTSELIVPLLYAGSPIGVASFESEHPDHFSSDDQLMLESLAAQAASLVQRERFARAAQALAGLALPRDDEDALHGAILAAVAELFDVSAAALALKDRGKLAIRAVWTNGKHESVSDAVFADFALSNSGGRTSADIRLIEDASVPVTIKALLGNGQKAMRLGVVPLTTNMPQRQLADINGAILLRLGSTDTLIEEERQLLGALGLASSLAVSEALLLKERDLAFTRAEHNARMMSVAEIAVGVAHDTRNILNTTTSAFRVAKNRVLRHEAISRDNVIGAELSKVEGGLDTLRTYYDRLKHFAKFDEPVFSECDVNDVLDEALMLMAHRLASMRIRIKRERAAVSTTAADRDKLIQVMVNLLSNAADAMKERGNLFIGTAQSGEMIEIRITDDGAGIEDDARRWAREGRGPG
jgi:GAF domain-containing protein